MALTCPKCAAIIPADDINVATDVAICRACSTTHKAADLVHDDVIDATHDETASVLSGSMPRGIRWRDDGQTLVIGAPTGSRLVAGLLAVFAGFWTMGAFVFVGDMLFPSSSPIPPAESGAGSAPTPPAPGADAADIPMAVVLLGIPTFFWFMAYVALCSRLHIQIRPDAATIRRGAFPIRLTRTFEPARVTAVLEEADPSTRVNGQPVRVITIKADEDIRFGGMLRADRKRWILAILRANLMRRR